MLLSPAGLVPTTLARRLREPGIPVVFVDPDGSGTGVSSVSVDDVAGGRLAVQHLIEQGKTRIAYLASRMELRQVIDRLDGARRAVAAASGVSFEVIEVGELDALGGRRAAERVLARSPVERPDGVFAVNDLVAIGFMQAVVMDRTVRVPQDLAVVGYDDITFAATAIVPLTSVRQPAALIGQRALEILVEEAADPELPARQLVFQPDLVVRASSGSSVASTG